MEKLFKRHFQQVIFMKLKEYLLLNDSIMFQRKFLIKWQRTYSSLEKYNKGTMKQKVIFTKREKGVEEEHILS